MQLKKIITNASLTLVAISVSVILSEWVARLFLNPADFLSVEMVRDNVLGAVPSPRAVTSFDSFGFRNRFVPKAANIVALGDSHTYGNAAVMEDSWPHVLGRLTTLTVYNMALGGYGPNQYFHLLEKALSLNPSVVLCGLYMGDDFKNAFQITYGLEYWAYLRRLSGERVFFDIWQTSTVRPSWHKRMRNWLSEHSVAYRIAFHGPVTGRALGEFRIRHASLLDDEAVTLDLPDENILETFRPRGPLHNLDQNDESVREGMRITFELLKLMNEMCYRHNVQFVTVVIPTKEMTFSEQISPRTSLPLHHVFLKLFANERAAREKLFQFLTDARIRNVDTLPALQRSVSQQLYARSANDMHPGKNGYRVIAEAVFKAEMWRHGASLRQ